MSKVTNKIPKVFDNLEKELTDFTRDGAKAIRQQIEKQAHEPKSGEVHGNHQSSAPGESWADDSGETLESFTLEEAVLKTTLESALWRAQGLEVGIENSAGEMIIEPRPLVEPATAVVLPTLETMLQQAIRRAKSQI